MSIVVFCKTLLFKTGDATLFILSSLALRMAEITGDVIR